MKNLFVPMQHNRNDLLILVFLLKYFRTSLLENNRGTKASRAEEGRKASIERKKESR